MKKFVYIDLSYQKGGTQRTGIGYFKGFSTVQGYILARKGSLYDGIKFKTVEGIFLDIQIPYKKLLPVPSPQQIYLHAKSLWFVLKTVKNLSDVGFISGTALFSNIYAKIVAKLLRKEFVPILNDFDFLRKGREGFLKGSKAIITISKALKEELVQKGFEADKIFVVYPPVEMPEHVKRERRKGIKTIGFIGRIEPAKGIEVFLKVLERAEDLKGVVAGGMYLNDYKILQKFNRLIKEKKIEYLGFLRDQDKFYQKIDVLVYPSLVKEGFGRAVLEALYRGIPVIGTDKGAVPEILENMPFCYIISPEVENILNAVRELKNRWIEPERIRAMALKKFPAGESASKLENIFAQLLGT